MYKKNHLIYFFNNKQLHKIGDAGEKQKEFKSKLSKAKKKKCNKLGEQRIILHIIEKLCQVQEYIINLKSYRSKIFSKLNIQLT